MRRFGLILVVLAMVVAACTPDGGEETTTTTDALPGETTTTTVTSTTEPPAEEPLDPDDFFVNLIWHQHQPLYPKNEDGVVTRPWVRVHATKDYYDMAALVAEHPDLRLTFNLTPVLLLQLEDIVNGTKDIYWTHTEIDAEALTDDEKDFILSRFFDINPRIIDRFPRYVELRDLRDAGTEYAADDWRDLQVLWNLGWTDPSFLAEEPLKALVDKGRGFAESDKEIILDKHVEIVAGVVDIHTQLWNAGQIEVITTPLAHPILPLIGDTDQALFGDPSAIMPDNRFQELPDAVEHVQRGLDEAERLLGRRPVGMWPGEGSVSQLVTPVWANEGVEWIATGEHVLGETLGIGSFTRDSNGTIQEADVLYTPYAAQHSRVPQLPMFFRDVELADRIGFEYSGSSAGAAVSDFMGRLANIKDQLETLEFDGLKVVTIVVDGENAWEHYDNDGIDFLNALYEALTTTDWVTTVTPSELLEAFPEDVTPLPDVFPASWFQPNFATWIGEKEEARAWDYLYQVRRDLARADVDEATYEEAFQSMLFAEGSDWFWWYGADQESGDDGYFDSAYRELLGQVYDALGQERPGFLRAPIIPAPAAEPSRTPGDLVTIDIGAFDDEAWAGGGLYDGEHALSWAFDVDNLYIRLDGAGTSPITDIYLGVPSASSTRGLSAGVPDEARQRVLGFEASHVVRAPIDGEARLLPASTSLHEDIDAAYEEGLALDSATSDDVIELAIPLGSLGAVGVGDRISVAAIIDEAGEGGGGPYVPTSGRGELQVPDVSNVEASLTVEDPTGDDFGPGSYTYPTDAVFSPGSYDLTGFSVGQTEDELVFEVTVASPIVNSWDSPTGLSIQTFDVYVDVDPGAGTGARTFIDGRNAALSEGNGWERALTIEGWESALFEATSEDDVNETLPTITILTFGDKGRVVVRVPRDLFPDGDPASWGYAVAVMSQEGFPSSGVRRVRDVESAAQQWRVGGGDGSLNGTRILDLVWPEEGIQEQMLSATPIASGDPNSFTPDDFGQVDLLVSGG